MDAHNKPQEQPQLGWHSYCIAANDFDATYDFYQRLGFTLSGGAPEHGWAALNNATADIAVMKGLPGNCLNFRGGDIAALRATHKAQGLALQDERAYDSATYPADWHTGDDGKMLPLDGSGSYGILDPDGRYVMMDSVPKERAWMLAGNSHSHPGVDGTLREGQKLLGRFELCLNVKDIDASVDFYRRLGLAMLSDQRGAGRATLGYDVPNNFRLSLYQGHIDCDCLNFRGADVFALSERLKADGFALSSGPSNEKDGSASVWLKDPDGNAIYLNTMPGETL